MQVVIDKATKVIIAYGRSMAAPAEGLELAELAESEEPKMAEAGLKILETGGTVTVLPLPAEEPVPNLLRDQYQTAKSVLAAFLANSAPTAAEVVQAVKMLIRVDAEIIKRMGAD
jgi:hypothetical protein